MVSACLVAMFIDNNYITNYSFLSNNRTNAVVNIGTSL